MARVVLENVSKVFHRPNGEAVWAVRDICLAVEDHELVVLAGPSGCGKSTTLRLLAGLETVTSGTISIDGRVVNGITPRDRDVAMVFQSHALYPHLTVYENMAFGLKLRKFRPVEIERRVRAAAATLGLSSLLDRLPDALSGGQRQRVAVGRALVRQPEVFLFDEPFSNLDATLRRQMRLELKRLQVRLGTTTLFVTHDQAEAMTLGRRLAVMKDGSIQQVAEPLELYHRPATLFVAGFLGSPPMNFFRGVVQADGDKLQFCQQASIEEGDTPGLSLPVAEVRRGALARYVGRPVVLGLRPEEIVPAGWPAGVTHAIRVSARVDVVEPMGAETHVHGSLGGVRFAARWGSGPPPGAGVSLPVWLNLDQAHYFDPATEQAIG